MSWQAGGSHGRQSVHQCLVVHAHGIDVITSVLSSICNLQQALADAEHKVRSTARNVVAHAGYGA